MRLKVCLLGNSHHMYMWAMCALQGSLHLANTVRMKLLRHAGRGLAASGLCLRCLSSEAAGRWLAASGLCLRCLSSEAAGATRFAGRAALSTRRAGKEHSAKKKKKTWTKNTWINRCLIYSSSLFLSLMMPDKNWVKSDGWARRRPAICHPIKLRPQEMEKAFSCELSHAAAARQEPAHLLPPPPFHMIQFHAIYNRETKEHSKFQAPILKHPFSAQGRKPSCLVHSSGHRQTVVILRDRTRFWVFNF